MLPKRQRQQRGSTERSRNAQARSNGKQERESKKKLKGGPGLLGRGGALVRRLGLSRRVAWLEEERVADARLFSRALEIVRRRLKLIRLRLILCGGPHSA